jgi:hypothetical protein
LSKDFLDATREIEVPTSRSDALAFAAHRRVA